MFAKAITPILNVSDIQQSFEWFEKLGWQKCWDWGEPPTFGSVKWTQDAGQPEGVSKL